MGLPPRAWTVGALLASRTRSRPHRRDDLPSTTAEETCGGHSYFGSCSRWITSLEPRHGAAPIECSSFSSQTRKADRQALLEQLDRNLSDATQQRYVKTKYQVGAYDR